MNEREDTDGAVVMLDEDEGMDDEGWERSSVRNDRSEDS